MRGALRMNRGGGRPQMRDDVQGGFALLKGGDPDGAMAAFTAILEADPSVPAAHLGLGRVFAAQGDHQKAIEHFQEALALQPSLAPARIFAAESLEQLGEADAALAAYDEAIRADPTLSLGHMRKARLLDRQGRQAEAQDVLSDAVRRLPQEGGLRIALANSLARGGGEGGEAEFRRAVDLQPDSWFAHFGLGTALLQAKQYAPARDALQRAAKLAPDKPKVQAALGAALTGLGEHARAAAAFDEALRLDPSNLRAAVGAAMARSAAGRHREGLDVLRRVGRMGSRVPPVQKAMGDIYLAMGRPEDAVETYRAMVLNARGEGQASPELLALADPKPGEDPEATAKALQAALAVQRSARNEQVRADPRGFRERMMSRRGRNGAGA